MKKFENIPSIQYFKDGIYELPHKPVYIDGDIGDSSINFIKKYKNYNKNISDWANIRRFETSKKIIY